MRVRLYIFTLLKLILPCLLLFTWVNAADNSKTSILNTYDGTENAIIKRGAVRQISEDAKAFGSNVEQWKKDLILRALDEEKPTIVETAVYQIDKLGITEMNQRLIRLYHNAKQRFANMYDSRVRVSVVLTLGRTGTKDENVFKLFEQILDPETTHFDHIQRDVLESIKSLNDAKYVPMVKKYKLFMEEMVAKKKAEGKNIMLYQVFIDYSSTCDELIRTLGK